MYRLVATKLKARHGRWKPAFFFFFQFWDFLLFCFLYMSSFKLMQNKHWEYTFRYLFECTLSCCAAAPVHFSYILPKLYILRSAKHPRQLSFSRHVIYHWKALKLKLPIVSSKYGHFLCTSDQSWKRSVRYFHPANVIRSMYHMLCYAALWLAGDLVAVKWRGRKIRGECP